MTDSIHVQYAHKEMATFQAIINATGNPDPDIETVFSYLHGQALPLSESKNPMAVIAPAVNELHDKVRTLEFDLTASGQTMEKLKPVVSRAFDNITNYYIILAGIEPPTAATDIAAFQKELEFARRMVEIAYRVRKFTGGAEAPTWDPSGPHAGALEGFAAEIKTLRTDNPLPEFALQQNMVRRSACIGNIGCIIFAVLILLQTGILQLVYHLLIETMSNR